METQEYIATSQVRGDGEDFTELLRAAEEMPGVEVTKISAHYVTFTATPDDADAIASQLGNKYKIAPNMGLNLYG